jgi:hypothetical protein
VYFATAMPFFFSGTIVSLAVSEGIKRVDRVYFFDLLGAAAGCLALVPLLNHFGGPNSVLAASVLFAVSAAIWYNLAGTQRGRVGAVALALAFVVLIVYNGKQHSSAMQKEDRFPRSCLFNGTAFRESDW